MDNWIEGNNETMMIMTHRYMGVAAFTYFRSAKKLMIQGAVQQQEEIETTFIKLLGQPSDDIGMEYPFIANQYIIKQNTDVTNTIGKKTRRANGRASRTGDSKANPGRRKSNSN